MDREREGERERDRERERGREGERERHTVFIETAATRGLKMRLIH